MPDPNVCGGVRRVYAEPSLSNIIGYYVEGLPATGVEAAFDDYLTGKVGTTTLSNTVNQMLHRPKVGNDIYLTIDVRIQKSLDQHFNERYYEGQTDGGEISHWSEKGAAVVSNTRTGEVLGMLSRPYFDANRMVDTLSKSDFSYFNQLDKDPAQPLLNRTTFGRYVPGSTFKTMTLMAALDSGAADLKKTTFDEQHAVGPVTINGQQFGKAGNNIDYYTKHYPVDTEYGFTHSDNVIFAQLGVKTGAQTWLDYTKKVYVGQDIPFDLPIAKSSVLPHGDDTLSVNQLAENAFGQGVDFVTPMQMVQIDNTVANDGQLMRSTLLYKITDHDKNVFKTFTPQSLGNPIRSKTATDVRQAMVGVTQCGPGPLFSVKLNATPWGIIGKTGTGEASEGNAVPPHAWLITSAPYAIQNPSQLPTVSIVSMRENGGDGGTANAVLTKGVYNDIFNNNYVHVDQPQAIPANYCHTTGLLQG